MKWAEVKIPQEQNSKLPNTKKGFRISLESLLKSLIKLLKKLLMVKKTSNLERGKLDAVWKNVIQLGTVWSGTMVTLKFHNLLSSLARSKYLSIFSLSFTFTLEYAKTKNSTKRIFYFWYWTLCLVFCPRLLDRLYLASQKVLCVSFSWTGCVFTYTIW